MKIPKIGSRWTGQNDYVIFRVLHAIELDGHIWIHYCLDDNGDLSYSCYIESFLERFREIPN